MPFVIPFFIAHQGCPHQCLFCNQRAITGTIWDDGAVSERIEATIVEWLQRRRKREETHFAFYGGSFTCLPKSLQQSLLQAVQPWIRQGEIDCIRLSTRPDCIDAECCRLLREYGVQVVELGVQSLDDQVLEASLRGHFVTDSVAAVNTLQQAGFDVGIQLMPGLPLENRSSFMKTMKKTVALRPAFVRLYPVLVVRHSGLADLYKKGEYTPLSLKMAVILTAWARRLCLDAGIKVVRMGLQPSSALESSLLSGPYHPAFGELVMSREWLRRTRKILAAYPGRQVTVTISARDLSAFNGAGRDNITRLTTLGLAQRLDISVDNTMERGKIEYVVC